MLNRMSTEKIYPAYIRTIKTVQIKKKERVHNFYQLNLKPSVVSKYKGFYV